MKRVVVMCTGIVAGLMLTGCGADQGVGEADEANGIQIEARQDIVVTEEPLGDVVVDTLNSGDVATALCYLPEAQTQTGAAGSAVKIELGQLVGYAAVTDFPDNPEDRTMLFDVDEDALRSGLPTCSGE